MKKALFVVVLSVLCLAYGVPAYAGLDKGEIRITFENESRGKSMGFPFIGLESFLETLRETKQNEEADGYKCVIDEIKNEDINSKSKKAFASMRCVK